VVGAVPGDVGQRLSIVAGDQAGTDCQGRAVRQIQPGDFRIERHVGGGIADTVV
jgi:hypothetical protein